VRTRVITCCDLRKYLIAQVIGPVSIAALSRHPILRRRRESVLPGQPSSYAHRCGRPSCGSCPAESRYVAVRATARYDCTTGNGNAAPNLACLRCSGRQFEFALNQQIRPCREWWRSLRPDVVPVPRQRRWCLTAKRGVRLRGAAESEARSRRLARMPGARYQVSAACQNRCATSAWAMSLCAPDGQPPWQMTVLASML
jgi:hypothetical protein